MRISFVKGHMGGNTIVVLCGDEVPRGTEIEVSLRAMGHTCVSGHEAGILYAPEGHGDIKAKIVGFTSRRFISACGGFTQVLGKALVEAGLAERFGIPVIEPVTKVHIETDAGLVEVAIEVSGGKAKKVTTDMGAFLSECYDLGVGPVQLPGVNAMRVGKFLVLNADEVRAACQEADFDKMNTAALETLVRLQEGFKAITGQENLDFALYDWHPRQGGDLRAVYPHSIPSGHVEPACGTGTVAIGVACAESGEMKDRGVPDEGPAMLRFETGGGPNLAGPEVTELSMTLRRGRPVKARFSHSKVEVTADGRLWL
jgi:proline racemase